MKEVEADDRAGVAQQRGGGDIVGLLTGYPVGDYPPKRRKRPEGGVEHLAAGHLEDDIDGTTLVGLDQASVRPSGLGVDRDVGSEAQRQGALLLAGGGCDTRPAPSKCELDGQRADATGCGVHQDALPRSDGA